MSGPLVEAAGWALVHSLWQLALLGLALRVALRLAEGAPSTHRYAMACATMALMLAVPVATGVRAARAVDRPAVEAAAPAAEVPRAPAEAWGEAAGDGTSVADDVAPRWFEARGLGAAARGVSAALEQHLGWIVAGWLAGVGVLSLRMGGAWVCARRLTRAGTAAAPGWVGDAARRLSAALGLRRAVRVLASTRVHVPTVVGWLRPVVLVPVSVLTGLPPRQVELLLLHELAHVRRHDYLANLLQAACETLLFYHPAVAYAGRQVRAEREHCCDALAAGLAGAREYALALATLEETRGRGLALAANGGSLLARVRRLAQPAPAPAAAPPRLGAGVLALALALAAGAPSLAGAARPSGPARETALPARCPGAAEGSTLCPSLERQVEGLLAGYPEGASALVQEVRTGAVLAYSASGDGARGLTEPVLPASVWKLVVAALWWERGLGDGELACPASLAVGGGRTVRAAGAAPARLAGPHEMLVHSCNTAAASMALRLRDEVGEDGVRQGLRRLGFDVTAEGGARGRDTAFWATRSAGFRARMSPARGRVRVDGPGVGFALGTPDVETTPLHVARFVQAVGNDGTMRAPTVDAALAGRGGGQRVMSPGTARRLQGAMLDVVRRGTGRAAAPVLAGSPWTLGGKTGTAPAGDGPDDGWFAGLVFGRDGAARYVVVVRLPGGGPGGGAPARVAAGIARLLPEDVPGRS